MKEIVAKVSKCLMGRMIEVSKQTQTAAGLSVKMFASTNAYGHPVGLCGQPRSI